MGLVRFTVKATLLGGVVYYTAQQGVWSSPDESIKLYEKIQKNITPYVKNIVPQDVKDMPLLPSTGDLTNYMKTYWNKGVISSTNFLANLPTHVTNGILNLSNSIQLFFEEQTSEKP